MPDEAHLAAKNCRSDEGTSQGQNSFINATAFVGVGCSGVLVAPNKVLTAGHCVCQPTGQPIAASIGSSVVFPANGMPANSIPQTQPSFGIQTIAVEPNFQADGCVQGSNQERASYDIAVLTLATAVPASVATPVNIFFGSHNDLDPSRFATAGFGAIGTNGNVFCSPSTNPTCQPNTDGRRRNGPVSYIDLIDDNCGALLGEGPCWHTPIYMTFLWSGAPTISLSGDSGSPIVGFLPGSNVPQLVATHQGRRDFSGYWPDGQYFDGMVRVRLANTFITSFITSNVTGVATDMDGDGVSDAADNCPAGTCATRGFVGCKDNNPDQLDADGDGVGDQGERILRGCFVGPRALDLLALLLSLGLAPRGEPARSLPA